MCVRWPRPRTSAISRCWFCLARRRSTDRLRVQSAGGRGSRNGRKPPEIFWRLLRPGQSRDIPGADLSEPGRSREVRARVHNGDTVPRTVCCRHRRARRARIRKRECGPRLGIGIPRFAVPIGLRGVLHSDSDRREARSEVDYRRRIRSHGRRGRRRRRPLHSHARAARAVFRDHVSDATLLGRDGSCRQPAEPRLCPDARTKPSRTRGRPRSLSSHGSDDAVDAQYDVGIAHRCRTDGARRTSKGRVTGIRSSRNDEQYGFRNSGPGLASIARSQSRRRSPSPGRRSGCLP